MKTRKFFSLFLVSCVFIAGCSGTYGNLNTQSRSDSKVTQQELIDNWSDYYIWARSTVIVFDPKNDSKQILVGKYWGTVRDQASWDQIVKANTTSQGNISPMWANYAMTNVREIWGPEKQFYGYIIHQRSDLVSVSVIDENTMWLNYQRASFGGP